MILMSLLKLAFKSLRLKHFKDLKFRNPWNKYLKKKKLAITCEVFFYLFCASTSISGSGRRKQKKIYIRKWNKFFTYFHYHTENGEGNGEITYGYNVWFRNHYTLKNQANY